MSKKDAIAAKYALDELTLEEPQMKPKLTDKVRRGLWMIVARSATVMSAEEGGMQDDREERDAVLAAAKYAEAHWRPKKNPDGE